jgi:hypothetical protein
MYLTGWRKKGEVCSAFPLVLNRLSNDGCHGGSYPTGWPKKVEVCRASPLLSPHCPITAGVPMHTERGKPPVRPLPRHSRSGTTESASTDPACRALHICHIVDSER